MKQCYLLIGLILFGFATPLSAQYLTGKAAQKIVPQAQQIRLKAHSDVPQYIKFREGEEITLDEVNSWLSRFYKSKSGVGLELLNVETDNVGMTHYRYQQTWQGTPIDLSMYIVHVKDGKVVSMNGELFDEFPVNAPTVGQSTARQTAISHMNAQTFKWELPVEENHLKWETGDPLASYYPTGEVVIVPEGANFKDVNLRTAYKFNIYAHQPLKRADVYVDATTGNVIFENNLIHTSDSNGTATTGYSGVVPVTADWDGTEFRLREDGRGNGIITLNMLQGTTYGNAVDFTDADNDWNNVNAQLDQFAPDGHWGAEVTYDYFNIEHGRNSIDDNGFVLRSYLHYDQNFGNAFWDGQRMTYGDGGNNNPYCALDVAGHEVTHGLTTFTAGLIYQDESGALNESFSDVFGAAIEFYGKPNVANWEIGEDLGFVIRNMQTPNLGGDPDTYFGQNWFTGAGDNGGVHTNSGVQNFWFYLLTAGGSGTNDNGDAYNVNALGLVDAGKVAFRNLTVYLTPSSQYADARFFAIQSAVDLYGPCTPEVEAVTDAWHAVGIGQPYSPGVSSDFSASLDQSCEIPFEVDFTNLSNNGLTFDWNFGDGNTSTQTNPTHTYTSYGTFAVTLVADGSTCGIDTLMQPAYITIDSNGPCVTIMPNNGSTNTQTGCLGLLYDNGGPSENYTDAINVTSTIAPVGAATVTIMFNNFDIEPGSGGNQCDFDYVEIFDGPNTSSPSLGRFCNSNPPPASITSTLGSITINLVSDNNLNLEGFEMTWSCNLPTLPPEADFNSNTDTTCTGVVSFTDQSTNAPTSWLWDFGDGTSSTQQNPVHTYTTNGTYSVSLTATNGIGQSSPNVQANFVYVDLPTAPTVNSNSLQGCVGIPINLSANGSGDLVWYDAATGGNELGTGPTFLTPIFSMPGVYNYYVSAVQSQAVQNVGALDLNIGGGNFFNNGIHHLKFDVFNPCVIHSVRVFAGSAGIREVELRDDQGNVLDTRQANLTGDPNGERITLDFDVLPGTDYELGLSNGSNVDLYRNNNGPNFPYTLNGLLEITRSSANTSPFGFYYFFYDWEVKEPDCQSERINISITVEDCPPISVPEINAAGSWEVYPNPANGTVTVEMDLAQDNLVELELMDATGKRIEVLSNRQLSAGEHRFEYRVDHLANGVYYLEWTSGNARQTQKLVVLH